MCRYQVQSDIESLTLEVAQLEQVCLAFVVAHCYELTLVAEPHAERVLKNSRCNPWEVLENSVGGNMGEAERVLLPLGAEGEHLGGVIERQVRDRCSQVHQSLERTLLQ